jgi:hypothetical protein
MKLSPRVLWRTFALSLGFFAISFSWACIERPMKTADPSPDVISDFSALQSSTRNVDILFIVDNSRSMRAEQDNLIAQFESLMAVLEEISGGLPNVHIGVTSTDLGTAPYNLNGCTIQNGDNGKLMKGVNDSCTNPINQNYVVDIEPKGCVIEKNDTDQCIVDECAQVNCEQVAFDDDEGNHTEPDNLLIYTDANGCSRCRNYNNESLRQVFQCIANLDIYGCGFEQTLEAMDRAIYNTSGLNGGFLRTNAYLSIFFISDEDDCSAESSGSIFNDLGDVSITSTYGPVASFRCTEFGISCDEQWNRIVAPNTIDVYHNCKSRVTGDPLNLLYPVSKYTYSLRQIKDTDMIIAAAIAGPFDGTLSVGLNEQQNPTLQFICGEVVPGVRIKEFVEAFTTDPEDLTWAYTNICGTDYSVALEGLGNKIKSLVEVQCITTPLKGCPDPLAANTDSASKITDLSDADAKICEPACEVNDIDPDGNLFPIEVCSTSYEDGHPAKRDPSLPVSSCFHVIYNEKCDIGNDHSPSRGAEIIISRQTDPEPGTSAKITCQGFGLTEKLCNDGVDNDYDGNTDDNDLDCSK